MTKPTPPFPLTWVPDRRDSFGVYDSKKESVDLSRSCTNCDQYLVMQYNSEYSFKFFFKLVSHMYNEKNVSN